MAVLTVNIDEVEEDGASASDKASVDHGGPAGADGDYSVKKDSPFWRERCQMKILKQTNMKSHLRPRPRTPSGTTIYRLRDQMATVRRARRVEAVAIAILPATWLMVYNAWQLSSVVVFRATLLKNEMSHRS